VGIFGIASGKIVEEWWQEDLLGLLRQLEAIPAAGQVSVPGTDAP
jgi:hypothetical protein